MRNDGKRLAFLLRHDQEAFEKGIIDKNGYRMVSELVNHHNFTREGINQIVLTNNKQRFEYDPSGLRIRARQGHSIPVNVELTEVHSCGYLWHGTSDRFLPAIMKGGLKPQTRQYVHLSGDKETACTVGKRHGGKLRIITIDGNAMLADGQQLWLSNNGVYLAKYVHPKYFVEIKYVD